MNYSEYLIYKNTLAFLAPINTYFAICSIFFHDSNQTNITHFVYRMRDSGELFQGISAVMTRETPRNKSRRINRHSLSFAFILLKRKCHWKGKFSFWVFRELELLLYVWMFDVSLVKQIEINHSSAIF